MNDHLIFYDGDCAICHRAIVHLMQIDHEHRFLFAPLEGETAREILIGPNAHYARSDSLVLVEEFRSDQRCFRIRSQAVFRIYWLLEKYWLGWIGFLPNGICDWAYRWLAKHRHRLNFGWARPEFQNDRFLP